MRFIFATPDGGMTYNVAGVQPGTPVPRVDEIVWLPGTHPQGAGAGNYKVVGVRHEYAHPPEHILGTIDAATAGVYSQLQRLIVQVEPA